MIKISHNTKLADNIREAFEHLKVVEEKSMFGGIGFLVNHKLCIFVIGDELLCRIGAEQVENIIEENGVRQFINNGKVGKDYIYVSEEAYKHKKDFDNWIKLSLDFNPKAKAAKTKK